MTAPDDKARTGTARKPRAFRPEETEITSAPAPFEMGPMADEGSGGGASGAAHPPRIADEGDVANTGVRRALGWGRVLISALLALAGMAAGLWFTALVDNLLSRQDWIGWAAIGLMGLAGFAALALVLRECAGIVRLARLRRLRSGAEAAVRQGDEALARATVDRLEHLFRHRRDLAWQRARFAEHSGDILSAEDILRLAERELIGPLDARARDVVASSVRRVSVVTAISPLAALDMGVVAVENLRMLRRLATLYGGRPGFLGLLRLARMVLGHIVLTGGIALGDDLLRQMIGHGLTARLSARLGEGVFNGALTARIGIAAMEVCRPLPFLEMKPPRLASFVAAVLRRGGKREAEGE